MRYMGFPDSSMVKKKNPSVNAGYAGLIPDLRISPGEGNINPLQYSCLEIPWTEETGMWQFRRSQRVRHNLATEQLMT